MAFVFMEGGNIATKERPRRLRPMRAIQFTLHLCLQLDCKYNVPRTTAILHDNLFYVILRNLLLNDSMRPLIKQIEIFSLVATAYFNCKFFSTYTRSDKDVSSGFRPAGAMNCARDFSQSETEKYFDWIIIIIIFISRRFFVVAIQWIFIA